MEALSDRKLISRQYFRLLPIQILLVLVQSINGIISSIFGSNFGDPNTMSAIGLYSPISLLIATISSIFVSGSQIMCGKYMGRNQIERVRQIFSLDVKLSIMISGLITVIMLVFTLAGGAALFTDDPGDRAGLTQYMYGQLPGILPFFLGSQLFAFLSMENKNRRTMAATLTDIAVNLVANVVLVVILKMGTLGVSIAFSLGCVAFYIVQAQFYFTGKTEMRFRRDGPILQNTKDVLKMGYPGALVNLYQTIRGLVVNGLIVRFVGSAGLAAFATSGSLLGILWALPNGYVAVTRMLMSVAIGEEDRQSLADIMRVVVRRCIPLMCLVSGILIALGEPLTNLFYHDASAPVYKMTVMAFRLLPVCMPLSVFTMCLTCYSQTIGRQGIIHIESLLDGVICVSAFSALLVPAMKMNGVYLANILNGIVCILVFVVYAAIRLKRIPSNMEELMVIPKDFGVTDNERMDLSIRRMEEVTTVSARVIDFCRTRGIDEKRSFFAGLFLEEMAGNVVGHGFGKDRKTHSVDIRVVHKADDVILRIKDDCIPFNPKERLDMVTDEDPFRNIGIRMVYDSAAEVTYQNILGLNVLMIRI